MFIGEKPYQGRRGPKDFLRAICTEHKGAVPASCAALPEIPKVNVTIISDKRCTDCQPERLVGMLKNQVGNPVVSQLDYADPEGRKLFEQVSPSGDAMLPLVLFDDTLKADADAMGALGRHLRQMGTLQALNTGGSFQPTCVNEGGCKLDVCKNTLICRKDEPKKLDVFVMSQCPYGVQALNAMQEVLANFDDLNFNVNYIGSGDSKAGFQSLHGPAEVAEDLREICAIKKYPKKAKFMEYVLCRNKDIRSADWEKCATNGIDAKVIKACAEGDEGKKYLEENMKVANGLGIGSSPTWLANSKYKFAGIDAQTIKTNLCSHNPTLKGCDKTLSASTAGVNPAGGCAPAK
jgi:hypothetical protein